MASKIESMTLKRKITSRHGVDSRPLSKWLRDAWRAVRECGDFLCAASPEWNSRRPRRGVHVSILRAGPYYTRFSRFHSNNTGAASAILKHRRTPCSNQNCEYSHAPEHCRTAYP
jgi:hypothetical protein